MTQNPTASWDIEQIAGKANDDFLLTHEELIAIFMAHVPTSSAYYGEILAAFETAVESFDYESELERIKAEVEAGATEVVVELDVAVNVPGEVTDVPVNVRTVVNLQVNEAAEVTNYVVSHDVFINGETVADTDVITQQALDSVDIFVNIENPGTGGGGTGGGQDLLTGRRTGNAYHADITDVSSDPVIQGGQSYQLMAVGADDVLSAGDSEFNANRYTTIDNVNVIADDVVSVNGSLNPDARQILNSHANQYLGILDTATQTWALLADLTV